MTNNIIIFIHLMAAGIAIGSMVFAVILLLPSIEKVPLQKESEEFSIPYKSMELLAPTVFTCLLILIGTGVYYLLENYTGQMGLKTRILQPFWSETDLRCRCFFFKYLPDIQPSSSNRQPGSITRKQKSCPENDPANKKNDYSHSDCIFFSCFFWNLASKILNKA